MSSNTVLGASAPNSGTGTNDITTDYQNFLQDYNQLISDANGYTQWSQEEQELNNAPYVNPNGDPDSILDVSTWEGAGYNSIMQELNQYLARNTGPSGKPSLGAESTYLQLTMMLFMSKGSKCSQAQTGKSASALNVTADITTLNIDAQKLTQSQDLAGSGGATALTEEAREVNLLKLATSGQLASVTDVNGVYTLNENLTQNTGVVDSLNLIVGSSGSSSNFIQELQAQWSGIRGLINDPNAQGIAGEGNPTSGYYFTTDSSQSGSYLTSFGQMNASLSQKGDVDNALEASSSLNNSFQSLSSDTQTLSGALQQKLSLEQSTQSAWTSFEAHEAQDLFLSITKAIIANESRA